MVAECLADFEISETDILGSNFARYPAYAMTKKLSKKLCADRKEILDFVRENPRCLTSPYGYKIYTTSGNPRFNEEWRTLNILARKMDELGYQKLTSDLSSSFAECIYQAERLKGEVTPERREWALSLAKSSAALFLVHVLNIYEPQKSLFTNMLDANLQEDALGRANSKPAVSAIAKVVRKSLGWKGGSGGGEELRAEMIIALILSDRAKAREQKRVNPGLDFEKKCEGVLASSGFEVRTTRATGDFGADLIAEQDDIIFVIQCKNLNRPVGVKAVQEAIGARRHYTADFACVCADAGFTEAALELAASNRVLTSNSANLARSLTSAISS